MLDVIDGGRLSDVQTWVSAIRAAYAKTVESVIDVGRELLSAKEHLPHGSFERMVRSSLPFKERTAQMYMAIARSQRLCDPKVRAMMPSSLSSLYALARTEDAVWDLMISRKEISADKTEIELRLASDICKRIITANREPEEAKPLRIAEVLQHPALAAKEAISQAQDGAKPFTENQTNLPDEGPALNVLHEPIAESGTLAFESVAVLDDAAHESKVSEEIRPVEGEWLKSNRMNEHELLEYAHTLFGRLLTGASVQEKDVRLWCESYEWRYKTQTAA